MTIRGRIDRLEIGPRNQALVIDYKYSPGNKIRERVDESEAGNLVQGGLYLLAAERALGLDPVGMLYCGLKKEVSWGGWHVSVPGLERVGESRTPEALRELMDDASRRAVAAHEAITSGRVSAQPADTAKCRWCDYRDACRDRDNCREKQQWARVHDPIAATARGRRAHRAGRVRGRGAGLRQDARVGRAFRVAGGAVWHRPRAHPRDHIHGKSRERNESPGW